MVLICISLMINYIEQLLFFLIYVLLSWLHWVFFTVCELSLVAARGGYSLLQRKGFSLWWVLFVAEHRL